MDFYNVEEKTMTIYIKHNV